MEAGDIFWIIKLNKSFILPYAIIYYYEIFYTLFF